MCLMMIYKTETGCPLVKIKHCMLCLSVKLSLLQLKVHVLSSVSHAGRNGCKRTVVSCECEVKGHVQGFIVRYIFVACRKSVIQYNVEGFHFLNICRE